MKLGHVFAVTGRISVGFWIDSEVFLPGAIAKQQSHQGTGVNKEPAL